MATTNNNNAQSKNSFHTRVNSFDSQQTNFIGKPIATNQQSSRSSFGLRPLQGSKLSAVKPPPPIVKTNEPCVEPRYKNKFSVRLTNTMQPSQVISRENSQPKYYVLPTSKPADR